MRKRLLITTILILGVVILMACYGSGGYSAGGGGGNIYYQNEEAVEASPVAQALVKFMESQEKWEGQATDLLYELIEIAEEMKLNVKDKRWPRDSNWLWRRIKEVKPNLEAVGVIADRDDNARSSGGRKIILNNSQFKPSSGESTEEGSVCKQTFEGIPETDPWDEGDL